MSKKIIYWFRQDLRLADNPALTAAAKEGKILPIYILDDKNAGVNKMGAASRVWLHYSLAKLKKSLDSKLFFYQGDAAQIIENLCEEHKIAAIYWNRCYEPWRMQRDAKIKEKFSEKNIEVRTFNGSLLWEPWQVKKEDGSPYQVFTPFYRKGCLQLNPPRHPLEPVKDLDLFTDAAHNCSLEGLKLLPKRQWHQELVKYCHIGEEQAKNRLDEFLEEAINHYKDGRNFPAKPYVSRLSANLHFGEISPNQLWYAAREQKQDRNIDHFCSELGWREFSYSQLYFNHDLPKKNLQSKFDQFPWRQDQKKLEAWQKGKTGIPMVDAGMRQLWQTGYVHNRVRMIVGSFLVKNLRLDWRQGEAWFWDCLVDADLANNSASWQWIAGCGADAAPYFRIFNPVLQGKKFDPEGEYIKEFVPELSKLPKKYLFAPWEASEKTLKEYDVVLGKNYPKPIIDLKESRDEALSAFKSLKKDE